MVNEIKAVVLGAWPMYQSAFPLFPGSFFKNQKLYWLTVSMFSRIMFNRRFAGKVVDGYPFFPARATGIHWAQTGKRVRGREGALLSVAVAAGGDGGMRLGSKKEGRV